VNDETLVDVLTTMVVVRVVGVVY